MRIVILGIVVLLLLGACQPRLSESEMSAALPTLASLPTLAATPVIVPTTAPTLNPEMIPTELSEISIATAAQSDTLMGTPTLLASKTPTATSTQTAIPTITLTPTITATATATITLTPTEDQFAFSGSGQSSDAQATAAVLGSAGNENPFLNVNPQNLRAGNPNSAPAKQCGASPWFFSQYAPPTCPVEQPTTGIGVFQRFETGYMVWLEFNDKIYVMYNSAEQPRYQIFDDPYVEGAEERDNAWHTREQQPPQTWQPRRGFGEVWRQNRDLRFRIGWAVQEWETIYSPRYQVGEDGSISVEDPGGGIFYLAPRGTDWYLFLNR